LELRGRGFLMVGRVDDSRKLRLVSASTHVVQAEADCDRAGSGTTAPLEIRFNQLPSRKK
jgi:hypothetical protein